MVPYLIATQRYMHKDVIDWIILNEQIIMNESVKLWKNEWLWMNEGNMPYWWVIHLINAVYIISL